MAPDQPLVFNVTLSRDDLVAWGEWWYRHRNSRATRWTGSYLIPLFMLVLILLPPYSVSKSLVVLLCSLVVVTALAWRNLRIRSWYATDMARPDYAGNVGWKRYTLDRSYISAQDATGTGSVPWQQIDQVITTPSHVFVTFGLLAFILPRAQLSTDIERALVERGATLPAASSTGLEVEDGLVIRQVAFVAEVGDVQAVVHRHFRPSLRRRVKLALLGAAATVAADFIRGGESSREPLGLMSLAVAGVALALGIEFAVRWEGKRRYARQVGMRGETHVLLTEGGLHVQTAASRERVEWSWVNGIELKPNGLLLKMGILGVFVPRRAFETDAAFHDFALTALQLHDQHPRAA